LFFEKSAQKIFPLSLIFCVLIKKINSMKCSDKMEYKSIFSGFFRKKLEII